MSAATPDGRQITSGRSFSTRNVTHNPHAINCAASVRVTNFIKIEVAQDDPPATDRDPP
jgi:hypothetical protein